MNAGAFLIGVLFGIGLLVSGMTNPAKVQGFLDIFGNWDSSLMFVLGGAVLVSTAAFQWAKRRDKPFCEGKFDQPAAKTITPRLITGSTLFGIGWGLAGICPGPAWVLLGQGRADMVIFVTAMLVGMWLWEVWHKRS
ncbi:YeeE/YedE family protein [Stenoxybacter acetivorans]|uniref:YeeE/YedE family protein n=1 Tax=Stenoxybacter acetivorans TaxID=422441 RepID=UPI00056C0F9B|nr:YeeE/YedE family protein [Stenoxybacter acetivorans]